MASGCVSAACDTAERRNFSAQRVSQRLEHPKIGELRGGEQHEFCAALQGRQHVVGRATWMPQKSKRPMGHVCGEFEPVRLIADSSLHPSG